MDRFQFSNISEQLAVNPRYFLQITLNKTGKVLASSPGIGPMSALFNKKEKPVYFPDCFQSSDWVKYENNRRKARRNSQQSFLVDLQKINYPSRTIVKTKWEFFFITEDFDTCLGIGHPIESVKSYSIGLGDFIDSSDTPNEQLFDSLLENKLLGFWDFDFTKKNNSISSGLAQSLGYSETENLDKIPWEKHINSDDYSELTRELTHYFKTKENQPFKKEFRLISKQNQTIWVMCYGKTVNRTHDGFPINIQGLILDISERKKQEHWLQEHRYFLKDLAFQQSHTLRARVANILGLLEILDTEQQSAESKRIVGILINETQQLDASLKKSIKESVQQNKSFEKGTQIS